MARRWLALILLVSAAVAAASAFDRWRARQHPGRWLRAGSVSKEPPVMPPETPLRRPNRLLHEKSPYLLQHAYNPVAWRPWNDEALAEARREDKPIFLSIGYSTCYWCHVMEKESFEDPRIAELINASFIPIKVDREERPDLDALYMSAVQALSGQGGWPMTVFLTPEGKPFFGGTYFPPEDRSGLPGLTTVLRSVAGAWKTRRKELFASGESLTNVLQASVARGAPAASLGLDVLTKAAEQFAQQYDAADGGFGSAPKFPRSHVLSFLLRQWSRTRNPGLLAMVEATLDAMARGGIRDHLGGGFHRYSTDSKWLVPHFEKMLYDQALLALAYLEAYQVTRRPEYAEVAREAFAYVLRDLHDPGGAFYSAEDAGEVGKEGEFYLWLPSDVEAAVGVADAPLISRFYGVTPEGDFEGSAILHASLTLEAFAKQEGLSVDEARRRVDAARQALLAARNRRVRPHRDDKILTDWNGLMIAALAYGARALREPRYAEEAARAADFVLARLADSPSAVGTSSPAWTVPARSQPIRLLHRYRDGEASIDAFLDDYAFLSWGLIELYETTFEVRWLREAKRLTEEMVRNFRDPQGGGFFLSGARNEPLIAKTKELYDGALPSGNSVAALVLVRLGQLTMDPELQHTSQRLFEAFASQAAAAPHAFPQFLIALDASLGPSQEIVIAGDPSAEDTRRLLETVQERFLSRAVVILHPPGAAGEAIEGMIPFVSTQLPIQGKATAYVCQDYLCRLPTSEIEQLASLLDAGP